MSTLTDEIAALEARVTFDDECVRLLLNVKYRVWGETFYDPLNDDTQTFAAGLMSDLQSLCDRLKIKT